MNIPGMNADGSVSPPLHLQAAHRISEDGSAAAMRAQQHQLVIDATVASSASAGGAIVVRPSNTNGNANCVSDFCSKSENLDKLVLQEATLLLL